MFLTVSPIDNEPITLNFNKVESITFNQKKNLTEILVDSIAAPNGYRRYYVKESVAEINQMLESGCEYETQGGSSQELYNEYLDEIEALSSYNELTTKEDYKDNCVASVSYGEFSLKIYHDIENFSFCTFLHTPTECKCILEPIDATAQNLANLLKDLAKTMSGNILAMFDYDLFTKSRKKVKNPSIKKTIKAGNPKMKLIKFDKDL